MRPLAALTEGDARHLEGLLFDLDDTFLTHGALTRAAYEALWDVHEAKVGLVVVTGRPAAWGQVVATQWPVDAVITENGAISFVREGDRVVRRDAATPSERATRRAALQTIIADVTARVPELVMSDDVAGRISDVTWDIGEHHHPSREHVDAARRIIAEHGARSATSSVHLHATFDPDDKATAAVRLLGERFGLDATKARTRWAFAGDSGNDRACFAAFHATFGVSNVAKALAGIAVPPRWVASAAMGDGFVEIARALLRCRMRP